MSETAVIASSSVFDSRKPGNAVDGDLNTVYHSAAAPNQWVRVDLGDLFFIMEIEVFNNPSTRKSEYPLLCITTTIYMTTFIKIHL